MSFIYLAAPYTHPLVAVRKLRCEMINAFAARAMEAGWPVFSPISQSHEIARYLPDHLLLDHDFWMDVDLPILGAAREVWVLKLQGWEQSRGVTAELACALRQGKTVRRFYFDDTLPAKAVVP